MTESPKVSVTRRGFLKTGALAAAAAPLLVRAPLAAGPGAQPPRCSTSRPAPTSPRPSRRARSSTTATTARPGIGVLLDAFKKDFPKIKTSYVRLQTGALYAKITAERSAGRFGVDVLQLSDISPAIDFQKKGGWEQYLSPEYAGYKPEHQSTPAGYYGWARRRLRRHLLQQDAR